MSVGLTAFKCSECAFTIEVTRSDAVTPQQWQKRLANHLAAHIKMCHLKDDAKQDIRGIIREGTNN
jgi:hypothetical protein